MAVKPTHHARYVDERENFDADVTLSNVVIDGLRSSDPSVKDFARRSFCTTFKAACYAKYGEQWKRDHFEIDSNNISNPHPLPLY
jgi:hypothetical protein